MEQAESEAKSLRLKLESQELSAEDVEKMGKRREQAKNQIASLESLIEKKVSSVKDAEEDVSTAMKQLSTIVEAYNEKAQELKIVPELIEKEIIPNKANTLNFQTQSLDKLGFKRASNFSNELKDLMNFCKVNFRANNVY